MMSMVCIVARGYRALAFRQDGGLSGYIGQPASDGLVTLDETVQGIRDAHVVAKLLHELLRLAEVVPRDARVEMVDGLELEAAVEEVEPLRAVNVHCRAQHLLGKRLINPEIRRTHGEVRERDLAVDRCRNHVADHDENEAVPVRVDRPVYNAVAKPRPEEGVACKF